MDRSFRKQLLVSFSVFALALSGCATTKITSFTDPAFVGKTFHKFVVVTPGVNLEYSSLLQSNVCKALKRENVTCARALDMFPPTRTYDGDQVQKELFANNIGGYLVVAYGGGGTYSSQVGSMTYGSASVYGNTVTAYGSTVPVTSFSRSDGYSITLVDVSTANKAWIGGAKTQAQGLANITDEVFTSSLADQIAKQLKESKLIN